MGVTVIPIIIGTFRTVLEGLERDLKGWKLEKDQKNPNYSIVKINQNTEKSPGDLWRHVTQTTVKYYELTLVWRTSKKWNINDNKNYGTWKWRWYQSQPVHLEHSPKDW